MFKIYKNLIGSGENTEAGYIVLYPSSLDRIDEKITELINSIEYKIIKRLIEVDNYNMDDLQVYIDFKIFITNIKYIKDYIELYNFYCNSINHEYNDILIEKNQQLFTSFNYRFNLIKSVFDDVNRFMQLISIIKDMIYDIDTIYHSSYTDRYEYILDRISLFYDNELLLFINIHDFISKQFDTVTPIFEYLILYYQTEITKLKADSTNAKTEFIKKHISSKSSIGIIGQVNRFMDIKDVESAYALLNKNMIKSISVKKIEEKINVLEAEINKINEYKKKQQIFIEEMKNNEELVKNEIRKLIDEKTKVHKYPIDYRF